MTSWQKVFREGLAPSLPTAGLLALREALRTDDPTLIQGATTQPPPLQVTADWPCEAACATSYPFWKDGASTVGEIEEAFAKTCYEADQRLGDYAVARFFLNWFDDTPREEMRRELLPEVEAELLRREVAPSTPSPLQGDTAKEIAL